MDASRPTAVVSESWTRMFFARENAKHAYDTRTMAPSFWRKLHFSEFAKSTSYLLSIRYTVSNPSLSAIHSIHPFIAITSKIEYALGVCRTRKIDTKEAASESQKERPDHQEDQSG